MGHKGVNGEPGTNGRPGPLTKLIRMTVRSGEDVAGLNRSNMTDIDVFGPRGMPGDVGRNGFPGMDGDKGDKVGAS